MPPKRTLSAPPDFRNATSDRALRHARRVAAWNGKPFTLSNKDMAAKTNCDACAIPFRDGSRTSPPVTPTLTLIDPAGGYEPANTLALCPQCSRTKRRERRNPRV